MEIPAGTPIGQQAQLTKGHARAVAKIDAAEDSLSDILQKAIAESSKNANPKNPNFPEQWRALDANIRLAGIYAKADPDLLRSATGIRNGTKKGLTILRGLNARFSESFGYTGQIQALTAEIQGIRQRRVIARLNDRIENAESDAEAVRIMYVKSDFLALQGRSIEAIKTLEEAKQRNPNDFKTLEKLARMYESHAKIPEHREKAIEIYMHLGKNSRFSRELDNARKFYGAAKDIVVKYVSQGAIPKLEALAGNVDNQFYDIFAQGVATVLDRYLRKVEAEFEAKEKEEYDARCKHTFAEKVSVYSYRFFSLRWMKKKKSKTAKSDLKYETPDEWFKRMNGDDRLQAILAEANQQGGKSFRKLHCKANYLRAMFNSPYDAKELGEASGHVEWEKHYYADFGEFVVALAALAHAGIKADDAVRTIRSSYGAQESYGDYMHAAIQYAGVVSAKGLNYAQMLFTQVPLLAFQSAMKLDSQTSDVSLEQLLQSARKHFSESNEGRLQPEGFMRDNYVTEHLIEFLNSVGDMDRKQVFQLLEHSVNAYDISHITDASLRISMEEADYRLTDRYLNGRYEQRPGVAVAAKGLELTSRTYKFETFSEVSKSTEVAYNTGVGFEVNDNMITVSGQRFRVEKHHKIIEEVGLLKKV